MMGKYMYQVLLFVCAMMLTAFVANAELVRVEFSGATLEGSVGGDFDYAPGETFSGQFRFNTSGASDTAVDPFVGLFRDSTNLSTVSGIESFEFSTSEGRTVSFDREQVSNPLNETAGTIARQIQVNGLSSVVSNQIFQINDLFAALPGSTPIMSGDFLNLQPNLVSLDLQTSSSGGNPRSLFEDPNILLSGVSRSFGLDDTSIGAEYAIGRLIIGFTNGDDTALVLGDISYTVVPIPAAGVMFGSAIVLLGWIRRRAG